MSRRSLALLPLGLVLALLTAVPAAAQTGVAADDRYVVVLKDSAGAPDKVAGEQRSRHHLRVGHVYSSALRGYSATVPRDRLAALRADPRVAAVSPDLPVTASAQTLPTGVDRVEADRSSARAGDGTGTTDVDVAVIDTGIAAHPDLNVAGGTDCTGSGSFEDGNGHGTHVAGIIGARDNGQGVVGVAPGARLWSVRVLDSSGRGTTSTVICGLDWVTRNAGTIDVANMSLGGPGADPAGSGCATGDAQHDATCRAVAAGVTFVVAAGNEASDARNSVPAAYDEVITVSALADFNGQPGGGAASTCRDDVDDTFASFSNYGPAVDIIAPGVCILSTWTGGGYNTISGTSMASPHVAGAAALVRAANPAASPAEVRSALLGAASADWSDADDPDGVKEPLLSAAGL